MQIRRCRALVWQGCGDTTSLESSGEEIKYSSLARVCIGELVILIIQFLTAIDIHVFSMILKHTQKQKLCTKERE